MSLFVSLLHHPMKNRHGKVVTTAVTNLDIHDIARTCRTYEIETFYIVTPITEQQALVSRIIAHWQESSSHLIHPDRIEALNRVKVLATFDDVKADILARTGSPPEVAMPDATRLPGAARYSAYRERLEADPTTPRVIVFGTGWGIDPSFFSEVNVFLEPLRGGGSYNHLSVRSAAAIVLDRLCGQA